MNGNLTDTYKKEVSDILARIGEGLGKTILEEIGPKIKSINDEITSINQTVHVFKENAERNESFKSNLLNKVDQLDTNLNYSGKLLNKSYEEILDAVASNEKSVVGVLNLVEGLTEGIVNHEIDVNILISKLTESGYDINNQLNDLVTLEKRNFRIISSLIVTLILSLIGYIFIS
jgi:hypothetical protein